LAIVSIRMGPEGEVRDDPSALGHRGVPTASLLRFQGDAVKVSRDPPLTARRSIPLRITTGESAAPQDAGGAVRQCDADRPALARLARLPDQRGDARLAFALALLMAMRH
jgi:hypothetical protein